MQWKSFQKAPTPEHRSSLVAEGLHTYFLHMYLHAVPVAQSQMLLLVQNTKPVLSHWSQWGFRLFVGLSNKRKCDIFVFVFGVQMLKKTRNHMVFFILSYLEHSEPNSSFVTWNILGLDPAHDTTEDSEQPALLFCETLYFGRKSRRGVAHRGNPSLLLTFLACIVSVF